MISSKLQYIFANLLVMITLSIQLVSRLHMQNAHGVGHHLYLLPPSRGGMYLVSSLSVSLMSGFNVNSSKFLYNLFKVFMYPEFMYPASSLYLSICGFKP